MLQSNLKQYLMHLVIDDPSFDEVDFNENDSED